jgi:uncharacterized GH25 family protein
VHVGYSLSLVLKCPPSFSNVVGLKNLTPQTGHLEHIPTHTHYWIFAAGGDDK